MFVSEDVTYMHANKILWTPRRFVSVGLSLCSGNRCGVAGLALPTPRRSPILSVQSEWDCREPYNGSLGPYAVCRMLVAARGYQMRAQADSAGFSAGSRPGHTEELAIPVALSPPGASLRWWLELIISNPSQTGKVADTFPRCLPRTSGLSGVDQRLSV